MASRTPATGTAEPRAAEDGEGSAPSLAQLVRGLERRLLVVLGAAVLAVVGSYAWLRPDLSDPASPEALLLGLVGLLGMLAVVGLGLLVSTISRIREGFKRRDATRDRLVGEAEMQARRLRTYSHELERRNEDLRRFAYIVAHDLREPGRTVSTHARLAQRHADGELSDEAREELEETVQASQHLDRLLGDLLAYVTLDQHVDEPEPVDLADAVDEALLRLEADLDTEAAEIVVEELGTVRGHRGPLVRLFEELVSNAIKFSPDGEDPRVEIRCEEAEESRIVEVADDGIGMPPRHADRVFSMFERLHRRHDVPGTGAGLSICRRVAELHGGDIELDTTPGEGLTARIVLPCEPARPASEDELEALLEGSGAL